MSNSRRQKSHAVSVATASTAMVMVGIDWADQKHDVCWVTAEGRSGTAVIEQSPEKLAQWLGQMRTLARGGVIAIAFEKSRGPLLYALMGQADLRLYLLDPKQVARYRDSFASSGAKSDASDAALLLRLLRERINELSPLRLDDERTRRIAQLGQMRRELVDESTRLKLQLQAALKMYFPFALTLSDVDSRLVLDLLRRWPDPRQLRRAHPQALTNFLRQHRRTKEGAEDWVQKVRESPLLTTDAPVIEALTFRVKALVGQLQPLLTEITNIETALDAAMAAHPDAALFQSLPGAGRALAPRLLAAFGSDRERFADAEEVSVVTGIAPVTKQSGHTKIVTRRRACSRFLKQTFHEFADQARKWCPWSKAYYAWQRSQQVGHHAALRKLAKCWIRILFKVWKSRTPYDPDRYLQQLLRRDHPLLKFLEPKTLAA